MHALRRVHRFVVFVLVCASLLFAASHAASWPPLIPTELEAKAALVEPGASVEILAQETSIDDTDGVGATFDYYRRIKVFDRAGVDRLAKIEIEFDRSKGRVVDVEARTIKPDGSVVELTRSDVFEREIVKAGKLRWHAVAFAPPGLAPGAILEYRYTVIYETPFVMFPLVFQSEYPVRRVHYRFKPYEGQEGLKLQVLYLGLPRKDLRSARDGFYDFEAANLPAVAEEPLQGPEMHRAASMVIYYSAAGPKDAEAYWADCSWRLNEDTRKMTRPNKAMVAEAQRVVAAGGTDLERLRRLHDHCRSQFSNYELEEAPLEPKRKRPFNVDAADVLKNRGGTPKDINLLFVSLARALGFDARLALANDRTTYIFSRRLAVPFAFHHPVAAVRVDGKWNFYDPGDRYQPAATLAWCYTETAVIIANEKGALIEPLGGAPAEQSFRRQSAQLTLDEEGALEGDISLEYAGYFEADKKGALAGATAEEVEKHLLGELEPHLKGIEISKIKLENATQPLEPLRIGFHMRVPTFAERTGTRLLVQPSVFRRGVKALFTAPKRATPVLFPHRYHEMDQISLTVPEGYVIEAGAAPSGLDLGQAGKYRVELKWSARARRLQLEREFILHVPVFEVEHYARLKDIFEIIQSRDDYTLSFRQTEGEPARAADSSSATPSP